MLISGIQGQQAWEPFAFAPTVSSSEVPRAGVTRGTNWAPSTPGRLGYLATERLMGLAGFVRPVFWGLCFEAFCLIGLR